MTKIFGKFISQEIGESPTMTSHFGDSVETLSRSDGQFAAMFWGDVLPCPSQSLNERSLGHSLH